MNRIIITFFLILPTLLIGQNECEKYIENYIPTDLNDAISYFECKTSKDDLNAYKNKTEDDATSSLHFGAGMSIRNNWKLWAGTSEISKFFRNSGIHHAEDMSGIILTSLYRKLNGIEIDLDNQIKYYKDYWAESERKETERKKEEFNEYKVGNLVEFSYDYDFVSKKQEEKWENDKCFASGIVLELDSLELKIKVKLKRSCDKNGIVILKSDIYIEVDGKWIIEEKDKIEIMKKGETRWTSYELWNVVE